MSKAVDYFWMWFIDNHKQLQNLRTIKPKEQKHNIFMLNWHLHFYAPGLDYILVYPKCEKDQIQLIITANGIPEHFAKVEEIVRAAPKLKDWKFTAFVKPAQNYEEMERGLDNPYVFQDITLKTSDLKFIPLEYEGKMDMIIYLKNFTVYSNYDKLLQCIFIMMQDLLGEKSLYKNINFVELAQMPDCHNRRICLYDLQLYIDEINRNYRK